MKEVNWAIKVSKTDKLFGDFSALDNVSLNARVGKVTGLLGPNGAGKSTLINIMTTLLAPSSGRVFVGGVDVIAEPAKAREQIGLAGQDAAIDDFLTGRETLTMVGRLYGMTRLQSVNRATELLDQLNLTAASNKQARTYSGGMRKRLDLAASMVSRPKILFLDEPTTGLDPRTRLQLWDIIRELVETGTTILLTTQYLDEADALCDYIYVIDHGKMIVEGTSEELKKSLGQDVIELKVKQVHTEKTAKALESTFTQTIAHDSLTRRLSFRTKHGARDLLLTAETLKKINVKIEELSLHGPTLDDVFLAVTGDGS